MSDEIKGLIEAQGRAFEAFKFEIGEMKKADGLTEEKIARIEKSLDDAVEAKAKIEARLTAEQKAREDLEAKINRMGAQADSEDEAKAIAELSDMNAVLSSVARERSKSFDPMDRNGYAEYKAALDRFMRRGKDELTNDEVKTLSAGSDPDGGYFVTPDLTGRVVTKVYETSAMRQIASVQTISSDSLGGIEDLGEGGAGYADEQNTSGDATTPQVGKWHIPVYWIDTEPKATQQLLDDASVNIEAWLAGKVSDKFARFENKEFVAGSTGKIRGITSYDTAADDGTGVAWGKIGYVASGASGAFGASNPTDKIFDLIGTVKDAYLMGSRFLTRRSVVTAIRKFKDSTGQYLWQPSLVMGQPEMIAGYPITRAEDLPALGAGSLSLFFGDFSAAYQIVDRQGMRTMRDPYTSKPFVKFYTTRRVGGGMVNFEAIKAMKFAAS